MNFSMRHKVQTIPTSVESLMVERLSGVNVCITLYRKGILHIIMTRSWQIPEEESLATSFITKPVLLLFTLRKLRHYRSFYRSTAYL